PDIIPPTLKGGRRPLPDSALAGTRVVDLSQGIAGPYCARLLADLGAEVIKVEPPEGDYARRLGPFPNDVPHHDRGGLFLHLNANKKSVTLDLETTSGRVVLRKLLANADVLIESETPGLMASRALGCADEYNTTMYAYLGAIRKRFYSRHAIPTYPSEIFPCRDGSIVVIGGATGFPLMMAILIEQPEQEGNPLFQNLWLRFMQWEKFEEILRPYLAEHDWEDLLTRAQ